MKTSVLRKRARKKKERKINHNWQQCKKELERVCERENTIEAV